MKIIKSHLRFLILIVVLILFAPVQAQLPEFSFGVEKSGPVFHHKIIRGLADEPGRSRMTIYIQLPYDELQFVQSDEAFTAMFEVSITVFDQQGDQADSKIFKQDVKVFDFNETNSREGYSTAQATFNLSPRKYDVLIGIQDLDSREISRRKSIVELPDFNEDPLNVSDVIMADHYEPDSSGGYILEPNVLGNYAKSQTSLFLWYDIYDQVGLDSVQVVYRILDYKNKQKHKEKFYAQLSGPQTEQLIQIDRGDLESGKYRLELIVGDGKQQQKRNSEIAVNWIDMPVFATNMSKAVEQLKYIAKSKEIKTMKKADGPEMTEMFKSFWEQRDPTPQTDRNELMEEYYRRVAYTDATFGTYVDGWKTDRGMVYIILGPPNDIERHPFEPGTKPYEIWSYYRVNRQFVFVDYSGFGEYRLITPNWDVLRMDR